MQEGWHQEPSWQASGLEVDQLYLGKLKVSMMPFRLARVKTELGVWIKEVENPNFIKIRSGSIVLQESKNAQGQ